MSKELKSTNQSNPHPNLPSIREPLLSELVEKEIERLTTGRSRKGGIDVSRYEAPEEPSADAASDKWRKTLRSAYISSTYLSGRHVNLSLLEELGKNAWLISNSQLEYILKTLDQELASLKEETDAVNKERKMAQEASRGELLGLEETWKRGVGQIIEVQLATNRLQQELLERRQNGPS